MPPEVTFSAATWVAIRLLGSPIDEEADSDSVPVGETILEPGSATIEPTPPMTALPAKLKVPASVTLSPD